MKPWFVIIKYERLIVAIGYVALIGVIAYGFYIYQELKLEFTEAVEEIAFLSENLEKSQVENLNLVKDVADQRVIIDNFRGQISGISDTVGSLEKLAKTDPELLIKYSKIYFLNENYVPAKLEKIKEEYVFSGATGNFLIHADVLPFLERLVDEANRGDINLKILSAFRSFDTQASLKAGYAVTYGSGANQFSADQGYSEHQLGTSVDFTTSEIGANLSQLDSDPAYEWLRNNAHKYGFTLSYPEGNNYYKYEPWHWRFVGVELATRLHRDNKYFYDLDQRDIDDYLVKIFD